MRKENQEALDKVGATVDDLVFENEKNRETAKIYALYTKQLGDRVYQILTSCPEYIDMDNLYRMIGETEGMEITKEKDGTFTYVCNNGEQKEEPEEESEEEELEEDEFDEEFDEEYEEDEDDEYYNYPDDDDEDIDEEEENVPYYEEDFDEEIDEEIDEEE